MDATEVRISKHFMLSDFLGNHSVYTRGYANNFPMDDQTRLENLQALCDEGLEPILEAFGPMSIGYGYVSPELSNKIVKYQDPAKPSHHRFDLGAASDICVHRWVADEFNTILDLYAPGTALGSPIALAHALDYLEIPYSRLITYSESPYICLAIAASELVADSPRKAFYENRYMGVPKAKPDYRTYATPQAKARAFRALQDQGLEHAWRGKGYPTYHGGGFRQLQHQRVSKYSMVSDWLFDLKSISKGAKNVPAMNLDSVQDAFAAAGIVYDWLLDELKIARMSIVQGYVSHVNPYSTTENDWRQPEIVFKAAPPAGLDKYDIFLDLLEGRRSGVEVSVNGESIVVKIDVEAVLSEPAPGVVEQEYAGG